MGWGDSEDNPWGTEPSKEDTSFKKPAERPSDSWGASSEDKSDSWGTSSDNKSDSWGNSSDNKSDSWGNSSDNKSNSWGNGGGGGGGGGRGGGRSNSWGNNGGGGRSDSWGSGGGGGGGSRSNSWGNNDGGSSNQRPRGGNNRYGNRSSDNNRQSNSSWNDDGGSSNKRFKRDNNSGGNNGQSDSGWGTSTQNNDNQQSDSGWGTSTQNNDKQQSDSGWGTTDKKDDNQQSDSGWGTTDKKTDNHTSGSGWGDEQHEESSKNRAERGDSQAEDRPPPFKPDELDLEEEAKLQTTDVGENFQKYREQKVTCVPNDLIKPIERFEDVITSELLLKNIKSQNYTEMTPIQKWAMPTMMEGYDLIGCAQTGSGKTAAFLLPVLQTLLRSDLEPNDPNNDCQNPYCLIISPTRELANQIHVHAMMLSRDSIIKCHVIYGQISTAHIKSKLSTGCHVLVATPGRLKDFVQRGWIGFKNIKYIILDEGDRLVDEGFTSDIREFFNHPTMPPKDERQTLFFSATFKDKTQLAANEYLKDGFVFLTVGRIGAANEDIRQEFLSVSRQEKKRELKKILEGINETDRCIIFTQTKSAADMLAGYFTALKLSSTSIHGDRLQSQREAAIKAFKRGEKRFLISSPVGNRGLDLPKVALVINYDLPPCIDEYVHRIGRTGRAGHTGRAISFYDEERDRELLPELLEILKEAKQEIPDWMSGVSSVAEPVGNDEWNSSSAAAADNWDSTPAADNWDSAPATDNWDTPAQVDPPSTPKDDWVAPPASSENASETPKIEPHQDSHPVTAQTDEGPVSPINEPPASHDDNWGTPPQSSLSTSKPDEVDKSAADSW